LVVLGYASTKAYEVLDEFGMMRPDPCGTLLVCKQGDGQGYICN
jgi:hypothetical protein